MRKNISRKQWVCVSLAVLGIIGVAAVAPQANAATKEVHQAIIDAIVGQDQMVPVHFEANGANILNLRLSSTSVDGYSGRISFTAGAGNDVNNDGQYTIADCDARIRIDFDANGDDFPETLGMDAELKGGLPNTGFITIGGAPGAEVDGIYLSVTDMSTTESCEGTVVLLLSKTVS